MSEQLLPCPFCGSGEDEIDTGKHIDIGWYAYCHMCGTKTDHYDTYEEAITTWNTRAPSASASQLAEACEAAIIFLGKQREMNVRAFKKAGNVQAASATDAAFRTSIGEIRAALAAWKKEQP